MRSTFFGVLWLCVVVVLEFSVVFFSFFDLTILLPIPNIPRGTPDSKLLEDLGYGIDSTMHTVKKIQKDGSLILLSSSDSSTEVGFSTVLLTNLNY